MSHVFEIHVPIFTPMHPKLGRYTSVLNPAYNLLIKPAINGALGEANAAANLFYQNTTATELCERMPKAR